MADVPTIGIAGTITGRPAEALSEVNMKSHSQYLSIPILILFVGCQNKSSQNPREYSDALIVYPGATNIYYAKVNQSEASQTDQVTYMLHQVAPPRIGSPPWGEDDDLPTWHLS
jgi:hypothetical protein